MWKYIDENWPNVYLVIVNNIPLPFFFFKHNNKQNLSNFYTISGRIILDSSKLIERPNASGLNISVLRLWKSPSWSVSPFLPFTVPMFHFMKKPVVVDKTVAHCSEGRLLAKMLNVNRNSMHLYKIYVIFFYSLYRK